MVLCLRKYVIAERMKLHLPELSSENIDRSALLEYLSFLFGEGALDVLLNSGRFQHLNHKNTLLYFSSFIY